MIAKLGIIPRLQQKELEIIPKSKLGHSVKDPEK
jgi:hypothetical protein